MSSRLKRWRGEGSLGGVGTGRGNGRLGRWLGTGRGMEDWGDGWGQGGGWKTGEMVADREGGGRLGRWLGTGTGLNCRHGKQQQQAPSSFGKGQRSNLIKVCVCVFRLRLHPVGLWWTPIICRNPNASKAFMLQSAAATAVRQFHWFISVCARRENLRSLAVLDNYEQHMKHMGSALGNSAAANTNWFSCTFLLFF